MGNPELPLSNELDTELKIQTAEQDVVEGATKLLEEKANETFDEESVTDRYERYRKDDITKPLEDHMSENPLNQ